MFQYRKRYEVTCDDPNGARNPMGYTAFQYRKRYEVTCDMNSSELLKPGSKRFNTASGMRSHVTYICQGIIEFIIKVSIPQAV